jgi:hypothetical protein
MCVCVYICMYIRMCVCVCVCIALLFSTHTGGPGNGTQQGRRASCVSHRCRGYAAKTRHGVGEMLKLRHHISFFRETSNRLDTSYYYTRHGVGDMHELSHELSWAVCTERYQF